MNNGHAAEEDLLYDFAEAEAAGRKARVSVAVIEPAPPPAPLRPVPVSTPETDPPADAWKRRAAARRLRANQKETAYGDPAAEDPVYTPRHELDPSPEFDRELPPATEIGEAPLREATGHRWRLLVTAGILFAGGLLVAAARLIWSQPVTTAQEKPAPSPRQRLQAAEIAASVPAAREALRAFFAAETPGEKQHLIRGGSALLPELDRYYAAHPDEPAQVTLGSNVEFLTCGTGEFILFTGEDGGGTRFEAPVELTAAGPRIDWRAMKGTSEPSFTSWLEQRPAGRSRHRVMAMPDHLYTGRFADSGEWLCLRIRDSGNSRAAWAYVPRSSSLAHRFLLNFRRSPQGIRICGEFEFPANEAASPGVPQVLLHSVQDHGWLDLSPEVQTAAPPSAPPRSQ